MSSFRQRFGKFLGSRRETTRHEHFSLRRVLRLERLEERRLLSIYYVDGSNLPGPGGGTLCDPFVRLSDAIDVASERDEVRVAPGIYHENHLEITEDLTIVGAGDPTTTLDGGGAGRVLTWRQGRR